MALDTRTEKSSLEFIKEAEYAITQFTTFLTHKDLATRNNAINRIKHHEDSIEFYRNFLTKR